MKKVLAICFVIILLLSSVSCGDAANGDNDHKDSEINDSSKSSGNPEELIDSLESKAKSIISGIEAEYESINEKIDDSYEKFTENNDLFSDLYENILSEFASFDKLLMEKYTEYYKDVFDLYKDDDKKFKRAIDDIYDDVYSGVLSDFYDDIYSGVLSDVYDDYYSGLLSDMYDVLEYSEWSEIKNDFYKAWSDAKNDFYGSWSESRSMFYTVWSVMNSYKYEKNRDYNAAMEQVEEAIGKKEEDDKQREIEEAERAERKENEVDFEIIYRSEGDHAVVAGYSGGGNHVTINSYSDDGLDVTEIADSAFEGCEDLVSVQIWADIETIGDSAFKDCSSLVEISIPSDTTFIGDHAFENCTELKDLWIWGDPDIGDYAFANCSKLSEVSISSGTDNIGAHAFENCVGLVDLYLWGDPDIGEYAFAGCTGLTEVSIGSKTKIVHAHAFDGCSELSNVYVWGNKTVIEKGAFANCPKLKNPPKEVEVTTSSAETTSVPETTSAPVTTAPPETVSPPETPAPDGDNASSNEIKIDPALEVVKEYIFRNGFSMCRCLVIKNNSNRCVYISANGAAYSKGELVATDESEISALAPGYTGLLTEYFDTDIDDLTFSTVIKKEDSRDYIVPLTDYTVKQTIRSGVASLEFKYDGRLDYIKPMIVVLFIKNGKVVYYDWTYEKLPKGETVTYRSDPWGTDFDSVEVYAQGFEIDHSKV